MKKFNYVQSLLYKDSDIEDLKGEISKAVEKLTANKWESITKWLEKHGVTEEEIKSKRCSIHSFHKKGEPEKVVYSIIKDGKTVSILREKNYIENGEIKIELHEEMIPLKEI